MRDAGILSVSLVGSNISYVNMELMKEKKEKEMKNNLELTVASVKNNGSNIK